MISEYRVRFETFTKNEYYVKAALSHTLDWNIGLDRNGYKALKFRGTFVSRPIESTMFVDVKQYAKGNVQTVVFSLLDSSLNEQFYHFCEDMVESTRTITSDQEAYNRIVGCFQKWKKMFKNNRQGFLTESQIMGLLAELYFLRLDLMPKYGEQVAVNSWSGQELTHKDFSLGDTWFEVKGIGVAKKAVRISSLEQLESDYNGYLIVYPMERMSTASACITLNEMVQDILSVLKDTITRDIFFEQVCRQGFAFNEYYDQYRYCLGSKLQYLVDDSFPKLTTRNVNDAIIKAEYTVALNAIEDFKVE